MDTKGLFQSRTVWSAIVAVLAIVLSALGVDFDVAELEGFGDGGVSVMEIVAAVSMVAAAYFRKAATKVIQ